MGENKYSYRMRYVPLAGDVVDLKDYAAAQMAKSASRQAPQDGQEMDVSAITNVSIAAINSMVSMCSMVYMMCIEALGEDYAELGGDGLTLF